MTKRRGLKLGLSRNRWGIRAALDELGLTYDDVASQAGVDRSLVGRTIIGRTNNRRVLEALLAVGVPSRLLALPDDLRGVAA